MSQRGDPPESGLSVERHPARRPWHICAGTRAAEAAEAFRPPVEGRPVVPRPTRWLGTTQGQLRPAALPPGCSGPTLGRRAGAPDAMGSSESNDSQGRAPRAAKAGRLPAGQGIGQAQKATTRQGAPLCVPPPPEDVHNPAFGGHARGQALRAPGPRVTSTLTRTKKTEPGQGGKGSPDGESRTRNL